MNPDEGLEILKKTKSEFEKFCALHGEVTEAATRANLIDKILTQACGWPEALVIRETHVERGYMDYTLLIQNHRYITVEAKREGLPFIFPVGNQQHRSLKISGAVLTQKPIREAIGQIRGYCDDAGNP
jgi:hypothetical protein